MKIWSSLETVGTVTMGVMQEGSRWSSEDKGAPKRRWSPSPKRRWTPEEGALKRRWSLEGGA
jgi:hypothetical protein